MARDLRKDTPNYPLGRVNIVVVNVKGVVN